MGVFDELIPGADRYEVEEEVGHGTYSEVHRARDRQRGGALVALKHMYLQQEGVLPLHVQRELEVLRGVHDPALVSLLDVRQEGFSVALILEHCLTDLRTLLDALRGERLDAAVAKAVARALLQGLAALHAAGFVHRDVAPGNILICPAGHAKLADFGQARRLPGGAPAAALPGSVMTPGAALCTRWYKPPELLFNARTYGPAVDLWSAGCVLAELLGGRPLLPGTSDIAQLALISGLLGSISEERWPGVRELPDWGKLLFQEQAPGDLGAALPGVPADALDLVAGLLQYNPDHRLTARQALQAEYFQAEPGPAAPAVLLGIVRRALA